MCIALYYELVGCSLSEVPQWDPWGKVPVGGLGDELFQKLKHV